MGLFGKTKQADPKEQVREWCAKIRKEGHQLDRQINHIKREELKVQKSIKDAAKKGDKDVCRILAKEIVHSRKAVSKIHTAKANLSSVEMQMKQQASQLRLVGALKESTAVMQCMQQLVRLPEIQKTMQEMSKEMMKAGIISEMVEDTMDVLEDDDELEDDVQAEVDKVLNELTSDVGKNLAKAPMAPEASIDIPEPIRADPAEDVEEEEEEADKNMEEMQQRLQALRS